MTALLFARWLYANLVPFSVFGMALAAAGLHYDTDYPEEARRVLGGLSIALGLVTVAILAVFVVIPDMCRGLTPSDWLYWLYGCYLP